MLSGIFVIGFKLCPPDLETVVKVKESFRGMPGMRLEFYMFQLNHHVIIEHIRIEDSTS